MQPIKNFCIKPTGKFHVIVVLSAVIFIVVGCCEAQVTFSRDWNAGKRSADTVELHRIVKIATNLYDLLISQIRQLATCELRNEDIENGASQILSAKL